MVDTESVQFLPDQVVEALLHLTDWQKQFPSSTGYVGENGVLFASRSQARRSNGGGVRAIMQELLLEIDEAAELVILEPEPVDATNATPFAPRNFAPVPIFTAFPVAVLDFVVPLGYRLWLDGYAFDLFPNQSNELNYNWQLIANGQDVLNKGASMATRGRPVHTPGKVTVGRDKTSMILVQPGNRVQVLVSAFSNLGASDFVSACVFGYLEGVGQ